MMGLFSFLKKKESLPIALPAVPQENSQNSLFKNDADLNALSDLPPLPSSFSGNNLQIPSLSQDNPTSVRLEAGDMDKMKDLDLPPVYQSLAPLGDFSLPQSDDATVQKSDVQVPAIDEETLKNLFITDTSWKEPDWTSFEPYHEDTVEPPAMTDFPRTSDLPDFDNSRDLTDSEQPAHVRDDIAIYVRGSDCSHVNTSIASIDQMLNSQESLLKSIEEINKHEQLFIDAKNSVEYIQKRLMQMDHKLFS